MSSPRARRTVLLLLGGADLLILQFLAVRNLAEILFGTELVLFLAVLGYFLGLSAGYHLSDRLSPRGLRAVVWLQWATHLTLPYSLRWLGGFLCGRRSDAFALAATWLFGAVWASSLFSVVLPRLLAEAGGDDRDFARSYAVELLGGALGMAATILLGQVSPAALAALYQAILAIMLPLLLPGWGTLAATACGLAAFLALSTRLDESSVAYLFRVGHGLDVARVLLSADTPYQRADIIEETDGTRHLYLDGIRHYGDDSLSEFNYLVAGLPAALADKPRTVVVGSGSYEAAFRALARGGRVTSVELDPVVARAGLALLAVPPPPEPASRWDIVIDDAKHHFAHDPEPVDLVVMDVAGPFQRQVALLYTEEYLTLVKSRLAPAGLVSLPLNGGLADGSPVACRIARTLLDVFPDVYVLVRPDAGSSFAVASAGRPGLKNALAAQLLANQRGDVKVLDRRETEALTARSACRPIRLDALDVVWDRGWRRMLRKFRR